ncbi:hypothetical protein HJC23_000088 [Cyclotella cryptica]|uniref:CN hydrolase domain-containing protein n=1 Tax=Cyclotella cryptica TaxID=29204 RepID=A0ABD3NHQ0_9STRA|eukprot:CCRYP_020898-RA/>CCRYP_020898-RA protein AED:0.18 eAED:0.18 QI:404/1/1/1/0.33/0.25/4/4114/319
MRRLGEACWSRYVILPECFGFMGDNASHTLEEADPAIFLCEQEPKHDELLPNPFRQTVSDVIISHANGTPFEIPKIDNTQRLPSIVRGLQFIARESGMWISGGGVHTRVPKSSSSTDHQKIYNTHVIIDDRGKVKRYYHKIHLFDVSIPNKVNLMESKTTEPGTTLEVCDSPVGKLGLSICYDMRFSEMYVDLVKMGAQILLAPSAFTVPTGKAHWHTLLRARAIESQCYMIAATQVRKHNEKESYGHSLVYDPWGELLADAGGYDSVGTAGDSAIPGDDDSPVRVPSIVVCEIDLDKIDTVRERMPIHEHRAKSTYAL